MIEKLIDLIAPHQCIGCSAENNILCANCLADNFPGIADVCVMCSGLTAEYAVCRVCDSRVLNRIYVASLYKGTPKKLVKKFKFERAKVGYKALACALEATISFLPKQTIIVPVPTALNHIRQRGYDHSLLIAKELAKLRGLTVATPLLRVKDGG